MDTELRKAPRESLSLIKTGYKTRTNLRDWIPITTGFYFKTKKLNPLSTTIKTTPKLNKGFTLIELLVALSVFSLLLMLAIPSFRTMLQNSRMNSSSDALVNALNYARSTALDNGLNVKVCPIGPLNSTTCGTNWSAGWIVTTQPSAGAETLIQSKQNSTADTRISSNVGSIIFNNHGLASAQSNFTLCDPRGSAFGQSVEVMATGFIQAGNTQGQAVWNNTALVCP